jgi:hypothetical protein
MQPADRQSLNLSDFRKKLTRPAGRGDRGGLQFGQKSGRIPDNGGNVTATRPFIQEEECSLRRAARCASGGRRNA